MITLSLALGGTAAATDAAPAILARVGAVPEDHLYARLEDVDGRVHGKWRRRTDAEFHVEELADGTILRARRVARGVTIEDRRYDAGGRPLVSLFFDKTGLPDHAVVHGVPEQTVPLVGWTAQSLPGGRVVAPEPPIDLPGGSVRFRALGGELDVWTASAADPLSEDFRQGVVAGCGCEVLDASAAWVDGRPGVRYRLLVPDVGRPDAVDLWAVSVPSGLWLASFRALDERTGPDAGDPYASLLAGRVLLALVALEDGAPP